MSTREVATQAPNRLGRPPRGSEGEATLRILAAAKPIFLSEGYEAASIDAIAGSAGISKKTIYARFASKEDLFEAVIVQFIKEHLPSLEHVAEQGGSVAERIHRIALAILDVALTPDTIAVRRVIVSEAARFPQFARLLNDYGIARVMPMIERCLEDGNRTGEIDLDDVRRGADLYYGLAISGFIDRAELGLERPGLSHVKRETLKHATEFFLRACRSR